MEWEGKDRSQPCSKPSTGFSLVLEQNPHFWLGPRRPMWPHPVYSSSLAVSHTPPSLFALWRPRLIPVSGTFIRFSLELGLFSEFSMRLALASSRCHPSPPPLDLNQLHHPLLAWHSHSSSHCLSFSASVPNILLYIYPFTSLLSMWPNRMWVPWGQSCVCFVHC